MPKGIPNEKTITGQKQIRIRLNDADFEKLAILAQEQYRTPQLQASYLLKQVLAQVNGRETTAEKIIARAHNRLTGEA